MQDLFDMRTQLISHYYEVLEKGIGEMPDYNGCVYRYDEVDDLLYITKVIQRVNAAGEIHIPLGFDYFDESVTFINRKNMKFIDVGSIKEIAFNTHNKFPKSLKGIKGDYVTVLGERQFCDLCSLTTVDMKNLDTIGNSCFSKCRDLKEITLGKVTYVGDYAFSECDSLVSVNFNSLEICSSSDVFNHSGVAYFRANKLIYVDNSFFSYAGNLESVYAPSLSTLGKGLFKGCEKLKYCELGRLDKGVFNNYVDNTSYLDEHEISTKSDVFDVYLRNSSKLFLILPSMFSVKALSKTKDLTFKFSCEDFGLAELVIQFVTLAYLAKGETSNLTLSQVSSLKTKFLKCFKDGKFVGLKSIKFEIKIVKG